MKRQDKNRPVYMISVAAELAGVHPQTLRIYERKRLVCPQRSSGNTRLYSDADIERLRQIQHLTQDAGVNLAGVERIIEMQRQLDQLREEVEAARQQLLRARRSAAAVTPPPSVGLVRVQRGHIVRRDDR